MDTPSQPHEKKEPEQDEAQPAAEPSNEEKHIPARQAEVGAAEHDGGGQEQHHASRYASRLSKPAWMNRDNIGLVFDGVVTVATVVGVVFLILQWSQTEGALEQAKEANRISSEAMAFTRAEAKEQARLDEELRQSARAQVEIGRNAMEAARQGAEAAHVGNQNMMSASRADQRPWVLATRIKVEEIRPTDASVRVDVIVTNLGRSPALSVAYEDFRVGIGGMNSSLHPPFPPGQFVITGAGETEEPIRSNLFRPVYANSDVLGASVSYTVPISIEASQGQLAAILGEHARLYMAGRITYRDVFGRSHTTQFCYATENVRVDAGTIHEVRLRPYGDCNKAD